VKKKRLLTDDIAIAAVALAQNLSPGEVSAAGISVGAIVFLLGASGLITWVARVTPPCIVKGIQLGTGITLCIKAAAGLNNLVWGGPRWQWWDNYEWALIVLLVCFALYQQPRVPLALGMFILGLILSLIYIGVARNNNSPKAPDWPGFRFADFPTPSAPTPSELLNGFLKAGLGQLPLTTLNSVVALIHLAGDLFPERPLLSAREVAMSVGLMNLIGCFFGSTPYCHGSGGLAGQYRFGARSGASVIILGTFKIIIGLIFGGTLTGLLAVFPQSLLSVMLFISGTELACSARTYARKEASEAEQRDNFTTMIMAGGMLIAFKHDGIGFLAGIACHLLLYVQRVRMTNNASSSSAIAQDAQSLPESQPDSDKSEKPLNTYANIRHHHNEHNDPDEIQVFVRSNESNNKC
jgi:MFS superfamily sulfate permease-like transporter